METTNREGGSGCLGRGDTGSRVRFGRSFNSRWKQAPRNGLGTEVFRRRMLLAGDVREGSFAFGVSGANPQRRMIG